MAKNITITFDDGSSHIYNNVPDNVTQDQVTERATKEFSKPIAHLDRADVSASESPQSTRNLRYGNHASTDTNTGAGLGSLVAGAVRGAGSIGATILLPYDYAQDRYYGDREKNLSGLITGKQPISRNEERRQGIDIGLQEMGADLGSTMYKGGKLGAEIAGTLPIGGILGKAVGKVAPTLGNSIASGGLDLGANAGVDMLTNGANRVIGGAINGAATAGAVDPHNIGMGAMVGGALPIGVKAAGLAGSLSNGIADYGKTKLDDLSHYLMTSALKPTIAQHRSGDAAKAVQTLLDEGINPTNGGVAKIQDLIDGLDFNIKDKIANSTATIDKQKVIDALKGTRQDFTNQVNPVNDLNTIDSAQTQFENHPALIGNDIPVQQAQDIKTGTYGILKKKYGQVGTADTEAQKALARGLKEQIADSVPDIADLNARQSKLLSTLDVTERRAFMNGNNNPMGLTSLAPSLKNAAAFLADRSSMIKSLVARGAYQTSKMTAPNINQDLIEALKNPALRNAMILNNQ